jgi:phosphonoacetaldehyde hydrolase
MSDFHSIGIKAVIFDWAGTLIDFGSIAPVQALQELFEEHGVPLSNAEVRAPMGLLKRDHIRALLQMERVAEAWQTIHGSLANEQTIEMLNEELEQRMPEMAARTAISLPGAVEALLRLRARGVRIGSTTGYTRPTMQAVQHIAEQAGIVVDALYTPNEVPAGRPLPWMIYRNCIDLGAYPPSSVVKIGDTLQDIYEGLNAGAWTIGVVVGSSLLGLSESAYNALGVVEQRQRIAEVQAAFRQAGAHYIIDNLNHLDGVINEIEQRLAKEQHSVIPRG